MRASSSRIPPCGIRVSGRTHTSLAFHPLASLTTSFRRTLVTGVHIVSTLTLTSTSNPQSCAVGVQGRPLCGPRHLLLQSAQPGHLGRRYLLLKLPVSVVLHHVSLLLANDKSDHTRMAWLGGRAISSSEHRIASIKSPLARSHNQSTALLA